MQAVADPIDIDPLSPAHIPDLPAFYARLRADRPVYYYAPYDTFFFSRFADVWELLRTGDNAFTAVETNLPTPEYLRSHINTGSPPPFAATTPMAPMPKLASPWYEEMRNAHMAPLKPKAVARLAVSGTNVGPGLTSLFRVLGRERTLKRIESFLATLA